MRTDRFQTFTYVNLLHRVPSRWSALSTIVSKFRTAVSGFHRWLYGDALYCRGLCLGFTSRTSAFPRLAESSEGCELVSRLARIESSAVELPAKPGEAPTRLSLSELMKVYNVPALSIAVIENYKIVDVKAYGVVGGDRTLP